MSMQILLWLQQCMLDMCISQLFGIVCKNMRQFTYINIGITIGMGTKKYKNDTANSLSLSKKLSQLLQEKGVTESELAKSIELPYNTVKRLVDGVTTDPRLSTLTEICKYLDVPIDVLLGNEGLSSSPHQQGATPLSVPLFTWEQLSDPAFLENIDLTKWTQWYPIPPMSNEGLNKGGYAVETRPSMQPRFPTRTILIVDPKIEPRDGDLILVRILEDNAISLREIVIDPPTKQLMPIAKNSTMLTYEPNKHEITGVVVLNMLMRNKS